MSLPYDVDEVRRELEPALYQLLTRDVVTMTHWDVLRFLLEMHEPATLDEIAAASGRDSGALLNALGALTSGGWLTRATDEAGQTVYRLTQEQGHRARLDRLRAALHERPTRLHALFLWTRGHG